jgi:hypothetical protein
MRMEICSSEMAVEFQRNTGRSIPEDDHLCENLKTQEFSRLIIRRALPLKTMDMWPDGKDIFVCSF